jgi:hypothetical protein
MSSGDSQDLSLEVDRLRKKARALMDEANSAENELRLSLKKTKMKENSFIDPIIHELLEISSDSSDDTNEQKEKTVISNLFVEYLLEKKLSTAKLLLLVERIFERLTIREDDSSLTNSSFMIGDKSNSKEYRENEGVRIQGLIDRIINAQIILDRDQEKNLSQGSGGSRVASILSSRVRELTNAEEQEYQRRLARVLNERESQSQESEHVDDMMKATIGDGNQTQIDFNGDNLNKTLLWENIMQAPMWIPSSVLPFLIKSQTRLRLEDLKKIKSEVLMGSQFFCTGWDSTSFAGIYRGSFVQRRRTISAPSNTETSRGNEKIGESLQSEMAFQDIQGRLNETGLTGTIQLFLMDDPEWRPGFGDTEPPPVILAISSDVLPEQGHERNLAQNVLSVRQQSNGIFSSDVLCTNYLYERLGHFAHFYIALYLRILSRCVRLESSFFQSCR